jgi:histidinol-phosphate aminotransferase
MSATTPTPTTVPSTLPNLPTRRSLARWLGAGAACVAARSLTAPLGGLACAQAAAGTDVVRLSANENPYGPPAAALEAAREALGLAWRYPDEAEDRLREAIAAAHAVDPAQVLLGNGSSQILRLAADALTGPGTRLVTAEPTFESLGRYAEAAGAEVVGVPLGPDFGHDLDAMRRGLTSGVGTRTTLVYVCNPNNPTAGPTPPAALAAFLAALPAGVVTLVDEAYHHYAEGDPAYASVVPLLARLPDLLVVRTFSKIYGMAGLRCGYALGRPELVERLRARQPWDSVNVVALAAARAALGDPAHVAAGRARNDTTRVWVRADLERQGLRVLPSLTNFFMVDLGRDVGPVVAALRARGVQVGRRFPAMPRHLRVTVGRDDDMRAFLGALRRTLAVAA